MKVSGVFMLLSLTLFCFISGVFSQGQEKRDHITRSEGRFPRGLRRRLFQIDCGEFGDPKVYCTRESNPLCGSDGQTYGNKCAFCKAVAFKEVVKDDTYLPCSSHNQDAGHVPDLQMVPGVLPDPITTPDHYWEKWWKDQPKT